MFGIGRGEQLLATREVEDCLTWSIGEIAEGDEVWIITPYATMRKLGSIKRGLIEAAKRKARVTVVVRDEPEQVSPLLEDVSEAAACGLQLCAVHRLHAKIYWFEGSGCILTSANLVDGSFESSVEVGLYLPVGATYKAVRKWIEKEIETGMRKLSPARPRTPARTVGTQAAGRQSEGYCIRCSGPIAYDPQRPYCLEHFKVWAQYSNPQYPEKSCHACGKPHTSSMARPECGPCFAKGRAR